MSLRILVNGANGKMGQMTVKALENNADFDIVGTLGRQHNLAAEIEKNKPHIVIDFTNAASVFKNAEIIIQSGVHPVIGTSGLNKKQVQELKETSAKLNLGGIIAPNFSLGAVLMMKYANELANYFPHVEIIEMHHNGKLDSPSGTSMRTAELLAESRNSAEIPSQKTLETVPGARGANYQTIPIHSIRLPGLVAHQQVIFGGQGETLTIRHDTIDRVCFMPGIILACKKVMELKQLVYGLESLF